MLFLLVGCTSPSLDDSSEALPTDPEPIHSGPAWPDAERAEADPEDHSVSTDALAALQEYAFREAHNTQVVPPDYVAESTSPWDDEVFVARFQAALD